MVVRGAARRARFPLQTESVREEASMVGERNEALCSNRRGLLYSVVIKTKQTNKYTYLVLVEYRELLQSQFVLVGSHFAD